MSASTEISQNGQVVREFLSAGKIKKLLNSSTTRTVGFHLLESFLPQCSDEDFLQFCISWMQNCCKAEASINDRDYAIYLLSNLLKISSKYPELKKGACGPFQVSLEKHLRLEIRKNVRISLMIGRCFALLPCTGGGGNEGENYKKNWKTQFVNILSMCHSILNDLFADVKEDQEYKALEQIYDSNSKEISVGHLSNQFYNHSMVLNCMLLHQYPVPKSVPSDLIFQLICRGLALNPKVLARRQISSVISMEKVLPEIQCSLLSLLTSVIVSCKNQLLPYSHLICKLIRQILEWTEGDFTFKLLRISAYETLCNWLVVAGNGSCVELISSIVISNAVNDVKSRKKIVFLKETKLQNQHRGEEKTIRPIDESSSSSSLCQAGLKTLQFLLKFAGVLLKPEEHKFLQEVVVKLVAEVQKSSPMDVPVPFGVPSVRTELYSLLLELFYQPCPKWPPPTNYALRLFSKGINDPDPGVSSLCSAALSFATTVVHPQYDNGGFSPCEIPDNRSNSREEIQSRDGEQLADMENTEESEIGLENTLPSIEKSSESDKVDEPEKLNDLIEESVVSFDEDSRNTMKFLKGSTETDTRNVSASCTEAVKASTEASQVGDEMQNKKQRISIEEFTPEKTSSPMKEKLTESDSVVEVSKKRKIESTGETSHLQGLISSKCVSSESMNEEGQPKARYFLRSKAKSSSEEPEEALKRTNSPEIMKDTPTKSLTKNTPLVQSAKNRPRTRALSRVETNSETDAKGITRTPEKRGYEGDGGEGGAEEEDIKGAFDDSFVD